MLKKIWLRIFPNFLCHRCREYKVGFWARFFGLYHCEECEAERFRQYLSDKEEAMREWNQR